jgi:lipopolysaccharide export system permease protein
MNEQLQILGQVIGGFLIFFVVLWRFFFKKIHKLILKMFYGPFLITFSVVTFILLVQYLLKYVDELSGKDISILKFGELFFYFSFNMMPQSLPLAIMFSALMTYGNLGQHNELTAIKSAGISLLRILTPVFMFVVVLTVGLFYFSDLLLPKLNLKAYSLMYDIKKTKPALDIKQGIYYNEIPKYSIYVGKKYEDGETLGEIQIYDHSDERGKTNLVLADSGRMTISDDKRLLVFELFDGVRYSDYMEGDFKSDDNYIRSDFSRSKMVFDLSSFSMNETPEQLFARDRRMLPVDKLKIAIDSLKRTEVEERRVFQENVQSFFRYGLLDDSSVVDASTLPITELSLKDKQRVLVHAMNRTGNDRHQVGNKIRKIERIHKTTNDFLLYLLKKYSEAFACILMFLLGAPVGAIVKKGGLGYPVLMTVIFFIIYYVLTVYGDKMVRAGGVNPYLGVWGPFVVIAPVAIFFLVQARNDADLFDIGVYKAFFKRLFK